MRSADLNVEVQRPSLKVVWHVIGLDSHS
uniref:Uncharacterized protein n=1 Tax=Arundo donax TaxID=35708 RepID=A0A0A9B666_ARUDO